MTAPARFPLHWPEGRPRTLRYDRKNGTFKREDRPITISAAMDRLDDELRLLGGIRPTLSANLDVNLNGRPRSGQAEPDDPGVALYFTLEGKPMAMACDRYKSAAQNIAALAAHIEATRAIARYGVATAAETLRAFQALPPPSGVPQSGPRTPQDGRPWFEVLHLSPTAGPEVVQSAYRALAKTFAADESKLREINLARDEAMKVVA
jgi:hypothetical protein